MRSTGTAPATQNTYHADNSKNTSHAGNSKDTSYAGNSTSHAGGSKDTSHAGNSKGDSTKCYKCHEALGGDMSEIQGMHFHRKCFVCINCNKQVYNTKVTVLNSKIYCEACGSDKQLDDLPTCAGCDKALVGDCTQGPGGTYHVKCFTCPKCNTNLSSAGYVVKNSTPYCPACAKTMKN